MEGGFQSVRDDRLLVRRTIGPNETPLDALFAAADATDVDLSTAEPRLAAVLDGDALTGLLSSDTVAVDPNTTVYFELWGRGFLLTESTVEVYSIPSVTPESTN